MDCKKSKSEFVWKSLYKYTLCCAAEFIAREINPKVSLLEYVY